MSPEGKVFYKKEDEEFIRQSVKSLGGIMHGLCAGFMQGSFICNIPQLIRLKKSEKAHVVEYEEVELPCPYGGAKTIFQRKEE